MALTPAVVFSSQFSPYDDDGEDTCPFDPKIAVVVGIIAVITCATFVVIVYGSHCKRVLRRLQLGRGNLGNEDLTIGSTRHVFLHNVFSSAQSTLTDQGKLSQWVLDGVSKYKPWGDTSECPVCLSRFDSNDVVRLLPRCRHSFHLLCVDKWLRMYPSCPVCRGYVSCQDVLDIDNYFVYRMPVCGEQHVVVVRGTEDAGNDALSVGRQHVNDRLSFDGRDDGQRSQRWSNIRRSASAGSLTGKWFDVV